MVLYYSIHYAGSFSDLLSFSKNCIFTLQMFFNVHLQNIFLTVAFS